MNRGLLQGGCYAVQRGLALRNEPPDDRGYLDNSSKRPYTVSCHPQRNGFERVLVDCRADPQIARFPANALALATIGQDPCGSLLS